MLTAIQINHNVTQIKPIILNPAHIAIDENQIGRERPDSKPMQQKKRPILEARRRRRARLAGRYGH